MLSWLLILHIYQKYMTTFCASKITKFYQKTPIRLTSSQSIGHRSIHHASLHSIHSSCQKFEWNLSEIWVKNQYLVAKNTILPRQRSLISIKKLLFGSLVRNPMVTDQFITLHCTLFIHLDKNLSEIWVKNQYFVAKKHYFASKNTDFYKKNSYSAR